MGNSLTRKQIEEIYNSTPTPGQTNNNPAPSFNMSRDEIANIYNSYTPEIPKLDQNTTPTPTSDYRAEIERINKLKADTTAPRTEGENQAIDTYLNSLTDAQRYLDSQKPVSTTTKSGTKVKKQPIGTVEIKADGTRRFTKTMSANEKKNFENQIRRQNQLEQAKVVGKQAKENAQPKERALSANEQRDLERAQNAIAQAKKNDNPYKKLSDTAKKFTELPKKDKPRYDDRGFEINPSITENQSTVDEYLDPNKKLSQADEKKAKQLIREYEESDLGQKNENALSLVTDEAHPDGRMVPSYTVDENGVYHPYLELTPEERQYQQSIGALKTKVNDSESFLVGAMKTIPFVDALQKAGDVNGEYARMSANSLKQNPLAYMGGLFTGGAMSNAAGQFALKGTGYGDWLAKTLGADKSLGRQLLTDALMDAPVDVATDIIPTLTADVASGMSAGDVAKSTLGNIGINAAFNLGGSLIGNAGDIIGSLRKAPNVDIPVVENPVPIATTKNTVNEVADSAVKNLNNEIPIVENPIKNVVPEVKKLPETVEDIPKDVNDYVSTRDILIRQANDAVKTQNASEVARLEQAVDNMDNYMKQNYPEWFKGKNFKRAEYNKLNPRVPEEVENVKPLEIINDLLESTVENQVSKIADAISNENFRPLTYTDNDGYTYVLSRSTRDGEKWQLTQIADTGRAVGHTAYKSDEDLLQKLSKRDAINDLNINGEMPTIFDTPEVTLAEMMQNPDAYSFDDFERAMRTYDKNADTSESTKEDIIDFFNSEIEENPELSEISVKVTGGNTKPTDDLSEIEDEVLEEIEDEVTSGVYNAVPAEAEQAVKNIEPEPIEDIPLPEKGTGERKIGQYRTNSMEKTGLVDEETDPLEDYGYNVFGVEEQRQAYKERYKDSQDMARDLRQRATWDEVDARAAQDEWTELMRKGDPESIKAAKKLKLRMNYELREGGRLIQVAAELDDTASQLNQAQKAINDLVDKVKGVGTSEALDNLAMKIADAYDASKSKEDFIQRLNALLNKNLKSYAPSVKNMTGKDIQGVNDILNSVKKAKSLEDMSVDDILNSIYKANGGVSLTVEEQKKIYDILEDAKQYKPGSYQSELRLARAAKIATARAGSTLGQKVRGILYTNMLGNLKTAVSRNAWGNLGYQVLEQARQPAAALIDRAVAKATGQRGALGWNKEKTKSYFRGFGKGAADQFRDMKYHVNTGRSGEFGWVNALKNNNSTWTSTKGYVEGFEDGAVKGIRNGLSRMANDAEFYVTGAMKFGDRPFYEANYAQAKTELQQLLNKYGKNGVVGFEGIPDDSVDDVIDMIASVRAADSVFQKHGKMSEGLSAIRNGLADVSRGAVGVDILSTAASPFTMTPGNMLEKAIEYSPLGLIKNSIETGMELANNSFNQRRFVDELSRTATGIPVLAGAYGIAKAGGITGGYSEDPDERSQQRNDGYIEYGLKNPFNDKVYDASDIPVFGPFLQAGGAIAENGLNKDSLLQAAEAVTMGSAMQGYRKAFGADAGYSTTGRMVDNFLDTVKSSGTQLIPSLVRQYSQTIDPYKRDLGEYGTNQYYLNNIINSTPFRTNLPIKYDNEGNPVLQNQGRSIGNKILENFVLPMNVSEYSPSELSQEASRLMNETGDTRGFVPYAKRSDLRDWLPEDVEYSEELFREYKEELGEINSSVGNALLESDYYNSLEPSKQVQALADVYSGIKAYEKAKYSGEATDDKVAQAYAEGGKEGVINYLEGKEIVKSSGVSASSKASKIIQSKFDSGDKEGAQTLANDMTTLEGYGIPTKGQGVYADRGSYNYDAETYSRFYSQIDVGENGEPGNGSVTQDEMIKFFEKNHITDPVKMQKMWESFLTTYTPGETKVPYYDKESKTVKTKKPDDSFKSTIPGIEETPETKIATPEQDWESATLSDDPYTAIAQSGVGKDNGYINDAWDKAILADPSLTPQQFIKEWSVVDKDKSGSHSQQEIVDHMNSAKMDKEKGEKFLAKYWSNGWKKTAKLDNNGKWYYS